MASTAVAPVVSQQPSIGEKIDLAAREAANVAELFAPHAAAAVEAGVAVEPLIRGFIQMIVGLFRHHTKK